MKVSIAAAESAKQITRIKNLFFDVKKPPSLQSIFYMTIIVNQPSLGCVEKGAISLGDLFSLLRDQVSKTLHNLPGSIHQQ